MAQFKIGDWTVRPSLNLVERNGTSIKLEPRAMDLLVYLAKAGDRVVSADELLRHVWQGRVFDDGLVYKKINQLRNALGDDARGGRFIETVPKRGYRLVAPIVEVADAQSPATIDPAGPDHGLATDGPVKKGAGHRSTFRRLGPWLAGMAVALVAGGIGAVRFHGVAGISAPSDTAAISVAVLPFVSINGPDDEYFSDGLTEELLSRLSRVPRLNVRARSSSFYFKGRNEPVQTIGRLLDVQYVLNGSVRRSGDVLRVSVWLDDAVSGHNVWLDQFERDGAEVFAIQDEIALAVVDHLELTLLDEARSAVMQRATNDASAQDLYYRAKYVSERFELDDVNQAIAYYERAIAMDPRYAKAYVGLADALRMRFQVGELHPLDPSYERARDLLRKALELDPGMADAHALLGALAWQHYDCAGAEAELRLAERGDPDGLNVLMLHFMLHITCSWPPERMVDYARRLAEVHRFNPYASHLLGIAYWHLHDYETALLEFDRVLEQFPDYYPAHWSRYMTLNELERGAEALEEAKRMIALYDYGDLRSFLGVAYARVGDVESARRIFNELDSRPDKYWSPTFRGVLLLELGDRNGALAALEQAYQDRDWQLAPALHYKMLAPLHGEPRFERLVDLLGQRPRVERLRDWLRGPGRN